MASKPGNLPASLVSNLQNVLSARNATGGGPEKTVEPNPSSTLEEESRPATSVNSGELSESKPVVLVTNGDGIGSPGLTFLVDALVREGKYDVHVCAPESDKSASGHSMTVDETLAVSSVNINGATAFEVSGTPADCVSLALSGALFSWSKPTLVLSGINKGSSCSHHIFYSGAAAGAREALLSGVPSLSISLNWKNDESHETDFKDAVIACLPLIHAAIGDIEKGLFPTSCFLNIEIPSSPLKNKGFKVTRQSLWRPSPSWQAVTGNKYASSSQYMSRNQSLGIQLAQLSRDASAAGAARRLATQRKNIEIVESVAAEKPETHESVKKYFRLEFLDKEQGDMDDELDFRALENGYIAVTPVHSRLQVDPEIQASTSNWLASALGNSEETS